MNQKSVAQLGAVRVDKETGEVSKRVIKRQLSQMSIPFEDKHHERNGGKSMTVPGMSMTIREMVERHRRGLPIDQSKGALYHEGDEIVQDIMKMDLVDRQQYMDSVADALVEVRERLSAAAKTKADKEFLARVDQEVRERIAKLPIPGDLVKPREDNA